MNPGRKSLTSYLPTIIFFLTAVFFVLKEQRAFADIDTQGGLWNYIQLFFIGLAGFYPLYCGRQGSKIVRAKPFIWLLLTTFVVFLISFFRMHGTSRAAIYNQVMTVYPLAIYVIYFYVGNRTNLAKKTTLYYGYYIAASLLVFSLFRFFHSGGAWNQRGSVADVYYILGLLPLMMAYVRGKNALIPIFVCAVAIAFSGKRGGIIAMFLMIGVYYLVQYSPSISDIRQITRSVFVISVLFLIVVAVGVYLDGMMNLRIVERLSKMLEDGGSGRLSRWTFLVHEIPNSTFSELLFGREYNVLEDEIGGHAHNDFLEVLYIDGIVAFALYLLFFLSLLKSVLLMVRQRYEYAPHIAMSFVCTFVVANVSLFMVLPTYTTSGMLCLGIFMGHYVRWQTEPTSNAVARRRRPRSWEQREPQPW